MSLATRAVWRVHYMHTHTLTHAHTPLPPRSSNARLDWMTDSIILDLMSRGKLVFYTQELKNEDCYKEIKVGCLESMNHRSSGGEAT